MFSAGRVSGPRGQSVPDQFTPAEDRAVSLEVMSTLPDAMASSVEAQDPSLLVCSPDAYMSIDGQQSISPELPELAPLSPLEQLMQEGVALRGVIEQERRERARLAAKIEGLNSAERWSNLAAADGAAGMFIVWDNLEYFDGKRAPLEARAREVGASLSAHTARRTAIAEEVTAILTGEHTGSDLVELAMAYGAAASAIEELGATQIAHERYRSAMDLARSSGNELAWRFLELHEIRTRPEGEDAWEDKLNAIQAYRGDITSMALQAGTRRGEFEERGEVIVLEGMETAQALLRELHAGSLMVEAAIRVPNDLDSDDDEYLELRGMILDQMRASKGYPPNPREARHLTQALSTLGAVPIREAAEDSLAADLDTARKTATSLARDAALAEEMYARIIGGDDALAALLDSAYFGVYQQSGLPIDGLSAWWQSAYARHRGDPAIEARAQSFRTQAPHLFDAAGELLPRDQMAAAPDGSDAQDIEGMLHVSTGSMGENMAIAGGSSLVGMTAGAKVMAGAGVWCGPYAEICVPVGGAVGGIGGFFAGDRIVRWMHADEVGAMESQSRLAGTKFLRTTREEAEISATFAYAGYGIGTVAVGVGGSFARAAAWDLPAFARASVTGAGWQRVAALVASNARYAAAGLRSEIAYTGHYLHAAWAGLKGVATRAASEGPGFVRPDLDEAFELIYARLSPRELAQRTKGEWRTVFDDLVQRGDTKLFRAPKAPGAGTPGRWDGVWSAIRRFPDERLRLADAKRFVEGRLRAGAQAVAEEVPEIAQNDIASIGRKELTRHAFRLARTPELDAAFGKVFGKLSPAQRLGQDERFWRGVFDSLTKGNKLTVVDKKALIAAGKKTLGLAKERGAFARFWYDTLWSDEMAKSYRLGWVPWAFDKYFLKKNQDGSFELVPGTDGRVDTWWGLAGKWFGWSSMSTWWGFNTMNGGLIGNAMKGTTFVGFQGLSALAAGDANLSHLEGAADEQILFLGAMTLLAGGKSASGGPILRVLARTPFAQRIPSLGAFVSMYEPTSTLASPNYFRAMPGSSLPVNAVGLAGLSLPYNISMASGMRVITGKTLLDSDPYLSWQTGVKFFFVGTILNPTQWALGTKTAKAQGGTRLLGILFDLIPAMVFPPYYSNKQVMHTTLGRMAGEGDAAGEKIVNHFMSEPDNWMASLGIEGGSTVNRSFDVVGVMKRDAFEVTDPSTWHWGWRWEPDGVAAWIDGLEKGYTDKQTKEEIPGVGVLHPEVYGEIATDLSRRFADPSEWMGDEHRTRGMLIAAGLAKWYAHRAAQGEKQFEPFAQLIEGKGQQEWKRRFWDALPPITDRKGFLGNVAAVQEMPIEQVHAVLSCSYQVVDQGDAGAVEVR